MSARLKATPAATNGSTVTETPKSRPCSEPIAQNLKLLNAASLLNNTIWVRAPITMLTAVPARAILTGVPALPRELPSR